MKIHISYLFLCVILLISCRKDDTLIPDAGETFIIKYQADCSDCKVLFKDSDGKMVKIDNYSDASQLPDSLVVKSGFKAMIQVTGKPSNSSKVSAVIENRTADTRATVSKSENKNPQAQVEARWTAPF